MFCIFKKEVKNYLLNPLGYVFFTLFFFVSGLLFFLNVVKTEVLDFSGFFSSLFLIIIFSMPIITMGLFSDEFKLKTDKLLFTSLLGNFSIVFGKYFAALFIFFVAMLINLVYVLVCCFFTTVSFSLVFSCFVGSFLLAACLISIGLFVSCLTKNSVVAAFLSFGIFMFYSLVEDFYKYLPFKALQKLFALVSIMPKYNNFIMGVLNIKDILYFVSIIFMFFCLTNIMLFKKRWSWGYGKK